MAAITPNLEQEDLDPEVVDYFDCRGPTGQLQGLSASKACPSPEVILHRTHANLERATLARSVILENLQGRTYHLEVEPAGRSAKVFITYDEPLPQDIGLPFGLIPPSAVNRIELLTWTSKMGTPSFSIPAGPREAGGACPGAVGAQSVVPEAKRRKTEKHALQVLHKYAPQVGATPVGDDIDLSMAVCQHCYATTGNYTMYASMLVQQLVRYSWVRASVQDGSFVPVMLEAIDRANYKLSKEPEHWKRTGWRFFRIHDSGDFFNKPYFLGWKEIADSFASNNPYGFAPIMFWAPSRMWAVPGWIEFIDEVNGGERNLGNFVIRPSGYVLNQHAPQLFSPGGGWAAGSTVFAPAEAEAIGRCEAPASFDWDCRAYAVKNGPTCRGAKNPRNQTGCRACWVAPDAVVNYQAH